MAVNPTRLKPFELIRLVNSTPQGEALKILFEIENTSNNPLFIQEIQTTCGCIIPKNELPIVILPHRMGTIHLAYNTIKNTGYVSHNVYCYGNFKDVDYAEMTFDTNIVPQADYVRDYEELWQEQRKKGVTVREFVDGDMTQKGYYTE